MAASCIPSMLHRLPVLAIAVMLTMIATASCISTSDTATNELEDEPLSNERDEALTGLPQDVRAYVSKTFAALGSVADAYFEWEARSAERSRAISNLLISRDPDSVSKAIEAENEALATAHELAGETLAEFRTIVPPKGCEEAHRLATESLSLMEQGLKVLYEWLTGPPDSEKGDWGYQLLQESAILNQQIDPWLARCVSE